jgi:hypothetical protein
MRHARRPPCAGIVGKPPLPRLNSASNPGQLLQFKQYLV